MYDVGYCEQHNRIYEGLCKNCEVLICASCVLFGSHQKHDILSLKDGAMYVRNTIDVHMKKGILKKEFSESHLLEIREYHLRMEKYKNETIKKIDETFKEILLTLKRRKNELISEILDKFTEEKNKIIEQEDSWNNKQDVSERMLNMMKEPDDNQILISSKFIMNGIRTLNEKLSFREIKVFNDLDTSITIDKKNDNDSQGPITLSLEEILYYFSQYLTIRDPNILEFKA